MLFVQAVATGLFCIVFAGGDHGNGAEYGWHSANLFCIFRDSKLAKIKSFFAEAAFSLLFTAWSKRLVLLAWSGWHSLLVMAGLAIYSVCLGVLNSQNIRKSILITCPMVLIYNIIEVSVGGILNKIILMVSGVIGVVRYAKEKRAAEIAQEK